MEIQDYMKGFIDTFYKNKETIQQGKPIDIIPEKTIKQLQTLDFTEEGRDLSSLLATLEETVYPFRNVSEHKRNFAFIPAPVVDISKLGDLLESFYNPNAAGFYSSSGTAVIEEETMSWLCEKAGFDPKKASGIFLSGGSMANLNATIAARDKYLHLDDITKGVVYISDQAHHSVHKALHVIGIPDERIRRVKTDDGLKILPDSLLESIKKDKKSGLIPFIVIATAGTTNAGVIDPLPELADICQKEDLWLHVDGAFGASVLLSTSHKHLLTGIEKADSITWDAHKWLFQSYSCAMLLVKDKTDLLRSFSETPEYLEDASENEHINTWDLGLDLSRPARGVKLWLSLQALGTKKLGDTIDYGIKLAEYTESVVQKTPKLEIITPAQTAIINFRYFNDELSELELNEWNTKLSNLISNAGFAQILTTKLNGKTVLRMCTISPETTQEDIDKTIAHISECIETLEQN
ncbi:pyridoxal phosphate-dependent decarboxylase family protein [Vagococcus bubulae]|uniref:Glutamate decarboxylase n=1 Tax=Vagococcus bubulae TaxID=1977868 RepID=A0A429ZG93_9ENTE|nr:aspartate aminotransferase family protein [Vagococcus bubulae]RST92700.1 hypothetical protein CBF36_08360 [Vagococcus bubulae]